MKLFQTTIIILFVFSSIINASESNFFEDAKKHYEQNDFQKSKFLFQKHLIFNPRDDLSYLYLAKIYNKEENVKEEEKNLMTTLLLDPKNEEALFMLIQIQLDKSNFSEARQLNDRFVLICSKLCKNKKLIIEKLNNLEANEKSKKQN